MTKPPTVEDVRESLNSHVAAKSLQIREKYGPHFSWNELLRLLEDKEFVRYPCRIAFDDRPLLRGEFACPVVKAERPEEGFTIYVHPYFATDLSRVPWLVLYQLVAVNYGDFASPEDAETFGAGVLGITKDEYYGALCEMADEIGDPFEN